MVTAAKATVPTISDQASAMQLSQCAKNLATALAELRTASQKVVPIVNTGLTIKHWEIQQFKLCLGNVVSENIHSD